MFKGRHSPAVLSMRVLRAAHTGTDSRQKDRKKKARYSTNYMKRDFKLSAANQTRLQCIILSVDNTGQEGRNQKFSRTEEAFLIYG